MRLFELISKPNLEIARSGRATAARMALDCMAAGRDVVIVTRSSEELNELRALTTLFTPSLSTADTDISSPRWTLPWIVIPQHPAGSKGVGGWAQRMASLYALSLRERPRGIIVTINNFLPKLPPVDLFDHHSLILHAGDDMSPDLLLDQAIDWGFTRMPNVSQPGEASRRGDILDIFPPGYERPLRLEFFGDTLEDIRLFDAGTQRSITNIDEFTLLPVAPVFSSSAMHTAALERWEKLFQQGDLTSRAFDMLRRTSEMDPTAIFSGAWYENAAFLEDWLPKGALWLLPGEADVNEALRRTETVWETFLAEQEEEKGGAPPRSLVMRRPEQSNIWRDEPHVHFEPLVMGHTPSGADLPERRIQSFQELFSGKGDEDRPWQYLVNALKQWTIEYRQVILTFINARSRNKFLKLAEQDGIRPALRYQPEERGLFALIAPFRQGIELTWDKTLILGEDVLQPKVQRSQRVATGAFKGLDRYEDLNPGDLLVHRDYGIARFGGLFHLAMGGTTANDFLLLEYAGEDKLYLPVDRLAMVQRFKGADSALPAVDRLGGTAWTASKDKARKAIEKIAADLVEMYALRKITKGYSYGPIGELYREFEASFGFEETPDQARAIEDVLADMEKDVPMDRLVCGDVGFGKTEVALRAAFRAATEGRQVALLCPTTVLAEQHYQTFRSRLANFPLNVGMLSRFVSREKQKETLQAAARGTIDILIGTHRLLSKDVQLPNLGLLILDEEQRFGVRHKERLKEIKKNVDVLTLTATPIPRTLQLSMSGIRELSVIETAPPERKPVATALLDRDPDTLRTVIERELSRDGQVFWVYNRVQGLERAADFVRSLAPNARIGMAHGQMSERELESTMHKFWHGELDILVSTAIIESGLDFPRANTLIVDQAQMFGLGQLYQLRGRVGRSDRQAYAVFVVNDLDSLTDLARQRMRIILEMDYLGAGFQVAMEDLRLRGAGNILGEAQTGHMTRLGLDLFLEMLEEAVAKLKDQAPQERPDPELSIGISAHIPENYIADARQRLKYYKALSSAQDAAAQHDVELELRDRFGPFPQELELFIQVLSLKRLLKQLQVIKADLHPNLLRLTFAADQTAVEPQSLIALVSSHQARLVPPATLELRFDGEASMLERFGVAREILTGLLPPVLDVND